jgi:hypothetical protein
VIYFEDKNLCCQLNFISCHSAARNLIFNFLLQRFSYYMNVFATTLQNIRSDLVSTGMQAPTGINIFIYFEYSRLRALLCFLSDNTG